MDILASMTLFTRYLLTVSLVVSFAACGSSKNDGEKTGEPGKSPAVAPKSGTGTSTSTSTSTEKKASSAVPAASSTPDDLAKVFEGDWADKLLAIMITQEVCEVRVPKLEALAADAEREGRRVWQAEIELAVSSCFAGEDNTDEAVAHLSRAIDLGFADCFFLRTDENMQKLASRPDYASLLERLQTNEADVQELVWIVSEYQAIFHDISMMITENMNRLDSDITVVPQSAIPSRPTTNQSVIAARAMLISVQRYQQMMVLQSDQSRVEHITSMSIINNMGDGTSGPSQTDIMMSAAAASDTARARAAQVSARAYAPQNASTQMVACSDIPN